MTTDADIVPQFRDTFRFGDRVVPGRYPYDIAKYYGIPLRQKKEAYTILFPNRMTDIYNPLGALNIFAKVLKKYPRTVLKINSSGELRPQVESRIRELGIADSVVFLDGLKAWDDLIGVYASCDIMILPAKFSNGNFTLQECAVSGLACIVSDRVKGNPAELIGTDNVLPLSEDGFAERICHYIENPMEISAHTEAYREKLCPLTFEGTAHYYADVIERMCK